MGERIASSRLIYADRWNLLGSIQGLPKALGFTRKREPIGVLQAMFSHPEPVGGGRHLDTRRFEGAHQRRDEIDPGSGQPYLAGRLVGQDVGRLDVFMNEAALVKLTQSRGNCAAEAQEAPDIHGHAEQLHRCGLV